MSGVAVALSECAVSAVKVVQDTKHTIALVEPEAIKRASHMRLHEVRSCDSPQATRGHVTHFAW